jgi:hypothetical protein
MEISPSWEAARRVDTQELPSVLWNSKVNYCVRKSPPLVPILRKINPVHTTPSYLAKLHLNIVWLNYSDYIWQRVQVMKLLIMQSSPTSCHFIPLRSKYSPQHLFSSTLSLCSSLNVRGQVSHTYETTGKVTVLHILIFAFLDSRREDRSSALNGSKYFTSCLTHFCRNFISTWRFIIFNFSAQFQFQKG